MVTAFAAGSTRTRIIDWVSGLPVNLASSSEPISSIVKGLPAATGGAAAPLLSCWPVCRSATWATGAKYATTATRPETTKGTTTRATVRSPEPRAGREDVVGRIPSGLRRSRRSRRRSGGEYMRSPQGYRKPTWRAFGRMSGRRDGTPAAESPADHRLPRRVPSRVRLQRHVGAPRRPHPVRRRPLHGGRTGRAGPGGGRRGVRPRSVSALGRRLDRRALPDRAPGAGEARGAAVRLLRWRAAHPVRVPSALGRRHRRGSGALLPDPAHAGAARGPGRGGPGVRRRAERRREPRRHLRPVGLAPHPDPGHRHGGGRRPDAVADERRPVVVRRGLRDEPARGPGREAARGRPRPARAAAHVVRLPGTSRALLRAPPGHEPALEPAAHRAGPDGRA